MDGSKLSDLNFSDDQISQLEKVFFNNKFQELFSQYLQEINEPENRKLFENEIIALEKQRGNDVLLVKPTPHYLLKTSVQGKTKCYINFTSSTSINKLNYVPAEKDAVPGLNVSIPYSLSPVRKIRDRCNRLCNVYCVVFHPSTLEAADTNEALKKAIQDTAFSAIEKSLNVKLDKVNVRTSKKASQGPLEMTIVKRNGATDLKNDKFAVIGELNQELLLPSEDNDWVIPSYKIKYRNEVDLQNSTTDRFCKLDILVPKQIIIEISLPLLKSIGETKLDVKSTIIELTSKEPNYKLDLTLPYEVDEDSGSAKFDATSRVLTLELDVKKRPTKDEKPLTSQDTPTPVDTLSGDSCNHQLIDKITNKKEIQSSEESFLSSNFRYKLPDYICNYHQNTLAFTLKVRNTVSSSFEYLIFEQGDGFWVKFYSLGSGHFPMYYAARFKFAESCLAKSGAIDCKIEDEYIFIYLSLRDGFKPLEYTVGVDSTQMRKAYLNDVESVQLMFKKDPKPQPKLEVTEIDEEKVVINVRMAKSEAGTVASSESTPAIREELQFDNQKLTNMKFSKFCDNFCTQFTLDEELHSLSESEAHSRPLANVSHSHSDSENRSWIKQDKSSAKKIKKKARDKKSSLADESIAQNGVAEIDEENDECSAISISQPINIRSAYRYSDLSARSILKKNRSYSESSGDEFFYADYSRSHSIDEVNFSSDSCGMSGPKKTVTFNDVISKKLFSSDISILEQRKRQKRRNRRKEGRASDSENSETESTVTKGERHENLRVYNENFELSSETDLTSSLSESSGGDTSDDQGSSLEGCEEGVKRPPKKQQPLPSSKKGHKKRGKKSARKNASTAKHHHYDDD